MVTISIALSKRGKHAGKYITIVDEIDSDLADLNWSVRIDTHTCYAFRKIQNKANEHLHRVILSRILEHELLSSEQVDHINGDGLDNRRENLRLATGSQNQGNRKLNKNSSSGYKGVYWDKKRKKWLARIYISGHHKYLGIFSDIEQAHKAYCDAAQEHFGEFGRI